MRYLASMRTGERNHRLEASDYERGSVPTSERKSWISIAVVWVAIGIDLSGAFLGVELAAGLDFGAAIFATVLGSLLLGLLAMACAYVGAATGLTTAMLSRAVFGKVGGSILTLAMSINLVGWFAVQASFFGSNAQVATLELTGANLPTTLFTITGGVLMVVTALWGYRSISRLSTFAVPLLLVLLLTGVVAAFATRGSDALMSEASTSYTFGGAVSLVMGVFILGVVSAPDMARWAKTPKQAMAAGFTGFLIGNSITIIVSVILSKLLNETELMAMFFALGLGGFAMIVLILAQWTTNTTNVYSAAISFSAISQRFSRKTLTLMAGAIGIVIAVWGAADWFISFISAISIVIGPFGGVYIANYFANRSHPRFRQGSELPRISPMPVIAWVLGIIVALMTTQASDGLGLGIFTLTSIPALDGLLVGFIASLVFEAVAKQHQNQATSSPKVEA